MASLTAASSDEAFEVLRQRIAEQRPEWSEYRFVETLWGKLRPDGFFFNDVIREGITTLRGIWRAYPIELLAAIDLAFWIPLGPRGGMETRTLTWFDLSPSWRFLQVAISLAKSGVPLNMLPMSGGIDLFRSLQAAWCKTFGWPEPERLCSEWLEALDRGTVCSVEIRDPARWQLTRNLFTQRLKDPIGTVISLDYEQRPAEFPMIVRPSGDSWDRYGHENTISEWLVSESLIKIARRREQPCFRSSEEAHAIAAILTGNRIGESAGQLDILATYLQG